jgi:hypothetical protein
MLVRMGVGKRERKKKKWEGERGKEGGEKDRKG